MFTNGVEFFVAEINLVDHRPSIVAAATVLVTIDRLLTKEELMLMALSVVPSWGSIEIVSLSLCVENGYLIEK
jgi:cyclin D5